jgi:SAM-dependent methyltransferase
MLRNVRLRYFDREIKILEKLKPQGNLLDVGCATGRFLEEAKKRFWKCYGVEISEVAGRYVSENLGIDVRIGELKNAGFEKEYFDIITLHHLIEHMSDPLDFLKNEVKQFLKQDGILVIEVPNTRCRQALLNGSDWKQISEKAHMYHFTPTTLRHIVSKAGYTPFSLFTLSDPRFGFFDSLRLFGIKDRWIEKLFGNLKQSESVHAGVEELYSPHHKTGLLRSVNRKIFHPLVRLYELINLECMLFLICRHK